jgi:2-polyprenyl-3-methyl-5-hydroxy-6-metoxy-1,4-benzoquinol methylase
MPENVLDKSSGWDDVAEHLLPGRTPIGAATVREWSKALPRGASILDIGCGPGVPISKVLIDEGFEVYGVDPSPKFVAQFRKHFPNAPVQCAAIEDSDFFSRTFDAVVMWGVMFLFQPEEQAAAIRRVAGVLNPGGRFLFTAEKMKLTWNDSFTERESQSLGREEYERILLGEGLALIGNASDEGDNFYYFAVKF